MRSRRPQIDCDCLLVVSNATAEEVKGAASVTETLTPAWRFSTEPLRVFLRLRSSIPGRDLADKHAVVEFSELILYVIHCRRTFATIQSRKFVDNVEFECGFVRWHGMKLTNLVDYVGFGVQWRF